MEELESLQTLSTLLITPDGYKELQSELEHLTLVKRAEISERLRDSMQHGEFSEDNSELDEVKFEQAIVENRIAELKAIFAAAVVLEDAMVSDEHASIGSWVTVSDAERGIEFEVRLVSRVEADPDRDLISNESPMGTAILGKSVDDEAIFDAPSGRIRYRIKSIRK